MIFFAMGCPWKSRLMRFLGRRLIFERQFTFDPCCLVEWVVPENNRPLTAEILCNGFLGKMIEFLLLKSVLKSSLGANLAIEVWLTGCPGRRRTIDYLCLA